MSWGRAPTRLVPWGACEVYTHVLPESERKAAELMDFALGEEAA